MKEQSLLHEIGRRIVFFDGGTGSLLQAKGLLPGELPETWNVKHPQVMIELHEEYLRAGADIIKTNTFGATRLKYGQEGPFSLERIVSAAVQNARAAVDTVSKADGRKRYVALSMGPTGKLLEPLGDLSFEAACDLYAQTVRLGAEAGADLVLIETMSDCYETKAAVLAAKENCDLPVFVTLTFDDKGKLLTGADIPAAVALLEGLGVDALGLNCGLGPVQMLPLVEQLLSVCSIPVVVDPNAGLPRTQGEKTVYDIDAATFAQTMQKMVRMGVRVAGGCCGTTPEHIRQTVALCHDLKPVPIIEKGLTVVSSYTHAVEIGRRPVRIGERINPTGKKRFKQALRENDMEYLLQEGIMQQEKGADILDVNVGLPEIDEPAMLQRAVKELQSVVDLPLQIDTADIEAMERALRIYNGKPMINSVNGKREVMRQVFPLVKRYGGVVVALALDEHGIPDTPQGRIEVAKKIYAEAARYGIARKDIVIDGLAMTVSSDPQAPAVTLETIRRVRDELGGKSILGVSNISFGLPQREIINSTFYAMALQCGLDAAILDPRSQAMQQAYHSFCALMGHDPQCVQYVERYGAREDQAPAGAASQADAAQGAGPGLGEAIERGLKERAAQAAEALLQTVEPLEVVNAHLIPALDRVGKGFEAGTVFLPQLLMSAEAAKSAFAVVKQHLERHGTEQKKQGRIILATVKGDIHDIGKNIVRVLLENYSYDVLDLGKDVPEQDILRAVQEQGITLVGLSALMTTTVPAMQKTIALLHEHAPGVRVMVGGAVLTQEYADMIGADAYCKDAMATVSYAQAHFGNPVTNE